MKKVLIAIIALLAFSVTYGQGCKSDLIPYADLLVKNGLYKDGIEIYVDVIKEDCTPAKKRKEVMQKIESALSNGTFSFSDSMKMKQISRNIRQKNYSDALTQVSELMKEMNSSKYLIEGTNLGDSLASLIDVDKQLKDSVNFLIGDAFLSDENYDKAIEYYEKYEMTSNRAISHEKIRVALAKKGIFNDVVNDGKAVWKGIIETAVVIAGLFLLIWILKRVATYFLKDKVEIVGNNDGFDGYANRFKFLFLVKNAEFYRTLKKSAVLPAINNNPIDLRLYRRKLDVYDDSFVQGFFSAIEGTQYSAIVKWLVLNIFKSRYSLQYSFKSDDTDISFSAILFADHKMLETVSKTFPVANILTEEQNLAQQLVAMVFQYVNERNS